MQQFVPVLVPFVGFSESQLLVGIQVALPVFVDALLDEGCFQAICFGEGTNVTILFLGLLSAELLVVVLVADFFVLFCFLALFDL